MLVAPSLLKFEVTNGVYRAVKAGMATTTWALKMLDSLDQLPIHFIDYPDIHRDAMQIAQEASLAATYDAHYLALARENELSSTRSTSDSLSPPANHFHLFGMP